MLAGLQPPDPPLSDGVVTLRVPDPVRDAPSLERFAADAEIARWIFGGTPAAVDPRDVFDKQLAMWERGSDAVFSIDVEGRSERIGVTRALFGLLDPFGFAEIGYYLLADARGQGYASRTVRLLAGWLLDDLHIGRIQARVHTENVASQRVLERVGFRREGIARSAFVLPVSRERHDCVMFSLLPGELAAG